MTSREDVSFDRKAGSEISPVERPLPVVAAADIGGTFTDIAVCWSDGQITVAKVLSTPHAYHEAIVSGLSEALAPHDGGLPPVLLHGTTVATNAVLTGNELANTALVTTRGFRDVLEIGRGRRPDLYDIDWNKPRPLVTRDNIIEIDERTSAGYGEDGSAPQDLEELAVRLRQGGFSSVVVSLINAYVDPSNEREVAHSLREAGIPFVVAATDLSLLTGEYERTSTGVLNAVLLPLIHEYLGNLVKALSASGSSCQVFVMQSNGGALPLQLAAELPAALLESGPAAGVLGAARLAEANGYDGAISFDMGGTTAKACLIDAGKPAETREYEVGGGINGMRLFQRGGGHAVQLPSFEIAEVGAGGGSIAWIDDGGALRVGPTSAGAVPGPACYGAGGQEPTVTDASAVLGYLGSDELGTAGLTIDRGLARRAIEEKIAQPLGLSVEDAAYAVHSVAIAMMGRALRAVSLERGRNPSDLALVVSGGAGPAHAVAAAKSLGVQTVVVPAHSGIFSAFGMLTADLRRNNRRTWNSTLLEADTSELSRELRMLGVELSADLTTALGSEALVEMTYGVELGYRKQAARTDVDLTDLDHITISDVVDRFEKEYRTLYSELPEGDTIEISGLFAVAQASGPATLLPPATREPSKTDSEPAPPHRSVFFGSAVGWIDTPVLTGRASVGTNRPGPFLLAEVDTTVVVPPGCTANISASEAVIIRIESPESLTADTSNIGASLEVVRHQLEAVVDEMALAIYNTARSFIKETFDFAVSLTTPTGALAAKGEGILLHLGSLEDAMRCVLERFDGLLGPGDVVVLNDPFEGGTHLPDLILVAPFFSGSTLIGYGFTIAHHADIGGGTLGGLSTGGQDLWQEGLVIPPVKLMQRGKRVDDVWRMILRNTRLPVEVESDLRAQLSALATASSRLTRMAEGMGIAKFFHAERELIAYSERMTRRGLRRIPDGHYVATDYLDDNGIDGSPIELKVALDIVDGIVTVDFSECSEQVRNGLNCNWGVTATAVYLAFRTVLDGDIPMNNGFTSCFTIKTAPGTVVCPDDGFPVAARATTGGRLVDLMFRVLAEAIPDRVWAAGDGNSSYLVHLSGRDEGRLYSMMEPLKSGTGARPTGDGVEGVSPSYGNIRFSSVETLERDYPVRVREISFVPGTGGAGQYRGANAIVREYEFLAESAQLYCRTDRRHHVPWGLCGGSPGAPSRVDLSISGDDNFEALPVIAKRGVLRGSRLRLQTAGGGGYGKQSDRDPESIETDRRQGRT